MAEITNLRDTSSTTESELETNQTEEVEVTAQNAEDKADREIIGITSQATDEEQSGAAEDGATVDSKNRQDFEIDLQRVVNEKKRLLNANLDNANLEVKI